MTRGMKGARACGRAIVAMAFGLAVAGCQTTGGAAAPGGGTTVQRQPSTAAAPTVVQNPTFTINFVSGCPDNAVENGTDSCGLGRKDCLYIQGGQKVLIVSNPPSTPFTLSFDPFAESKIDVPSGSITLTAGGHGKDKRKPYTFIVTAKSGCASGKPLDPQFILD